MSVITHYFREETLQFSYSVFKSKSFSKKKKICFTVNWIYVVKYIGFPGDSMVRNLPASSGDEGLIPELGRSPGKGNGNLRQYFCEKHGGLQSMGVTKESDTT